MRIALAIVTIVVLCGLAPSRAGLANVDYQSVIGAQHPAAVALARALDARLTLRYTRSGEKVYIQSCRTSPTGCPSRIAAFAQIITDSSNEHGVDPFLTAGIAMRESRFNPMAVGPVGERGIIQLHPQYRGKTVPFVYDDEYRASCSEQPGACQREVVDAGLALLNWAVKHCGGSILKGLGWYNSGRCSDGFYARAVLRERRKLLRIAKQPEPVFQAVSSK